MFLNYPPKESFNKNVNLLSLYGTCLYLPPAISTKELITKPKVVKDLLILLASFNLSPAAAVYFYLSDPARSTKCNFEDVTFVHPSLLFLDSIVIENTEWDLEESAFIFVAPTCLFLIPFLNISIVSCEFETGSSNNPSI